MPDAFDLRATRPALASGLPDDALEEINRLWTIASVFANTAHDVNNAIQVIAGSAELLEAGDLDSAVRRRVETIRTEAAKAARAVDRLHTYAKTRPILIQTLDVQPLVEGAVEMRTASAGRRRVVLSIDRESMGPCLALVDGVRLQQALLDLLLVAEQRVCGARRARVVVAIERAGAMANVVVRATSDGAAALAPEDGHPSSASAHDVTVGAQLWAAAHLAALQHGDLAIADSDNALTLTLSVPAA